MSNKAKRLILLELNEINFDVVEKYISSEPDRFPALKKLISGPRTCTTSEQNYEELEPWIQWPSVHTGKTYAEHGVFRLGDMVGSKVPQIFEQLESAGYKVGAVSAMNAENRLKNPAYFIPDPWTQTPSDSSWWSSTLTQAVSQAVNDNSQAKITAKSAVQILLALIRFARFKHYRAYLNLILKSRSKPWLKPLVLDLLLHDVHWAMFKKKQPNFSTLFLNAGAHIQHHYFFNAKPLTEAVTQRNPEWYAPKAEDPLADVLKLYDVIVEEYFSSNDAEIVLSTGLSQVPYNNVKFYYRLNDHKKFLMDIGIAYQNVYPRMTRDFLIEFLNSEQALEAQHVLSKVHVEDDNVPLFGEIDNRGSSLFVTLTYPDEIVDQTIVTDSGKTLSLKPLVSFVAIKNGMHQGKGFAFFTSGISKLAPPDLAHVSQLNKTISAFFERASAT